MKKILTLLLLLASMVAYSQSQIDLPIDWDQGSAVDYSVSSWDNISNALVPDPENASNTTMRFVKNLGCGPYGGTILGNNYGTLASDPGFSSANHWITVRMYSTAAIGTPIMLKIETADASSFVEKIVLTTKVNEWENMVFDFSTGGQAINYSNVYKRLGVLFNFATSGGGETFYMDNIIFGLPPVVSSFAPTSASPGDVVNISGSNFTAATAVTFGGYAAASYTVNSSTSISATIGVGGTGAVSVTAPNQLTGSLTGFTFVPLSTAPTVTSFTPTSRATGQSVTITGTNFSTATAVYFGGVAATSVNIISGTSISAVVDTGSTGSVSVVNPDGVGTKAGFTYIPPTPTVTSFSPASSGQGAEISIIGTNFVDVSAVKFGGVDAASFTVISPTLIKANVGSGASGSVTVTHLGGTGTKAGYTFKTQIGLPINWESATVDYTMTDFGNPSPPAAPFNVSSVITDPTNGSNKVLKVIKGAGSPDWAGTILGNDGFDGAGLSAAIPFTASNKFISARVYAPAAGFPILCKVENKANGGINAQVIVNTTAAGWQTMYFDIAGADHTLTYDKLVFFFDFGSVGSASSIFYLDDIQFLPAPVISGFTPTSAAQGGTVTINGSNFLNASAVSFGGVDATSFTVVSDNQITATVGLGLSGNVVVTRGGIGTRSGFTFIAAANAPTISSFSPTTAGYGQTVTINGSNFTVSSSVEFGGVAALSSSFVSSSQITAVVGGANSGNVTVTNADGIGSLSGFNMIPPAQLALPITWDSPYSYDYSISNFAAGALLDEITNDPVLGASNKVLKMTKTASAADWAGIVIGKDYAPLASAPPFTSVNRFMSMRVYCSRPAGTPILMKWEPSAGGASIEVAANTTVQNAWETLYFDFGNSGINYTGIDYDRLVLFPNFGFNGTAAPNTFYFDDIKFAPGPNVTSFSPTSAGAGTTVTINGDNFTGATSVKFGGVNAASFSVVNDNQITAVLGAGSSGSVSVTTFGTASLTGFSYICSVCPPTITSFSPTTANPNELVTINGTDFTAATAVSFGGTAAVSYTVVSATKIIAKVGAGTSGSVSVTTSVGTGTKTGFTFEKFHASLPITWDNSATVNFAIVDFNGVASTLVADPQDAGNTVLKFTKNAGAGFYAGATIGTNTLTPAVPFTIGNTKISMRIYSTQPVGKPVLLKLEGPNAIEKLLYTTSSTGWQVLTFDFAGVVNINDPYTAITIFCGFAQNAGPTEVYYIDNIAMGEFSDNVWTGSGSTNFATGSNWSYGFPPTGCSMNALVSGSNANQPVISSGTADFGSVIFSYGGSLTVASGATLNICGDVTDLGSINSEGTVVMNGSNAQSIVGSHNVKNFTVTKASATGDVTINGSLTASGLVTLSNANANLVVGSTGSLVLASNASGTGSIASIPAGASVNGNVTVQRYLNGTGDGWFLLGGSVQGADFTQWTDDMYMVAGTNLGGSQGVIGLGIQHSSIFKYDDAVHNVAIDTVQKRGWRVPVSGDALTAGAGFRVFLKSYNTPSRIVDNIGNIYQGNFTFPTLVRNVFSTCQPYFGSAAVNCADPDGGWNLLSNPYPSAIDWDAASGWSKPIGAGMQNGFWRWNSIGNGYGAYTSGSYVGAGPNPANPGIIPSGQGFFVKLASGTSATLSMTEAVKSNTSGSFLRTASQVSNALRIEMRSAQTSSYSFLAEVRFSELANDGIDADVDAPIMAGSGFHFSMPVGAEELIMNMMGSLNETKIVPMNVSQKSAGTFTFNFTGISSFPAQTSIFIRDNFNGTIQDIRTQPEFVFQMSASENGNGRFELIFTPEIVTANEIRNSVLGVRVYPNPVTGQQISIELSNAASSASVVLTDMFGRVVMTNNVALESGKAVIAKPSIASGVYTLKVTAGGMTYSRRISVQ